MDFSPGRVPGTCSDPSRRQQRLLLFMHASPQPALSPRMFAVRSTTYRSDATIRAPLLSIIPMTLSCFAHVLSEILTHQMELRRCTFVAWLPLSHEVLRTGAFPMAETSRPLRSRKASHDPFLYRAVLYRVQSHSRNLALQT